MIHPGSIKRKRIKRKSVDPLSPIPEPLFEIEIFPKDAGERLPPLPLPLPLPLEAEKMVGGGGEEFEFWARGGFLVKADETTRGESI